MLAKVEITRQTQEAKNLNIILFGLWDRNVPQSTLKALDHLQNSLRDSAKINILLDSSFDLDFCGGGVLFNWLKLLNQDSITLQNNALLNHQKAKEIFAIFHNQQEKQENISQRLQTSPFFSILNALKNPIIATLSFLGEIIVVLCASAFNPRDIRLKALCFQIQEAVIKAVPIISLACFLIGIVIAYQGGLQLSQFGASMLIVETSAILTLREMAPIITAIIIAGRSASAFSAEIGMMRATQEIDAMRVMGFNPMTFLVFPRIFALLFTLPLVVFIADVFGLLGGMLIAQLEIGISGYQFIERFLQMVEIRHFWIGMLKAPFFGLIIGLIGCYHGFATQKDTRSIGVHTTKSVVASIFCVIAFDALCSILFTQMGW